MKTPSVYQIYQVGFENIPEDYKPLEQSYCPQTIQTASNLYSFHLLGNLADMSRVEPEEAGATQHLVAEWFRRASNCLENNLGIKMQVLLVPWTISSFSINYDIKINEEQLDMFRDLTNYFSYLNAYLSYCVNSLPNDLDLLIEHQRIHLYHFNDLLELYFSLYDRLNEQSKKTLTDEFIDNIYQSSKVLTSLSRHLGKNYDKIIIKMSLIV